MASLKVGCRPIFRTVSELLPLLRPLTSALKVEGATKADFKQQPAVDPRAFFVPALEPETMDGEGRSALLVLSECGLYRPTLAELKTLVAKAAGFARPGDFVRAYIKLYKPRSAWAALHLTACPPAFNSRQCRALFMLQAAKAMSIYEETPLACTLTMPRCWQKPEN